MDRRSFYKSAFGAVLGLFGVKQTIQAEKPQFYTMRNNGWVLNCNLEPFSQDEIDRIHAEWEAEFTGPKRGKLITGRPGKVYELEQWGPK